MKSRFIQMNYKYCLKIFFLGYRKCLLHIFLYCCSQYLFYLFLLFIYFQTWLTLENKRLINGSAFANNTTDLGIISAIHRFCSQTQLYLLSPGLHPQTAKHLCWPLLCPLQIQKKIAQRTTSKNCLVKNTGRMTNILR